MISFIRLRARWSILIIMDGLGWLAITKHAIKTSTITIGQTQKWDQVEGNVSDRAQHCSMNE